MDNLINIENKDGQLLVSSLEVAKNFEKEHKHIMRGVRNLTAQNWTVKNMFYETTYENSRGQEQPMYLMNRDGFSWTQKGRLFIYDLLKNDGIVPLIEKEDN